MSDRSAPNYLSLKDFAKVDALKYFDSDSWQAVDPNRPFYIPEATLKRYNDLVHSHKEAVGVQQFNAREAILAVRERKALPWWKKIFGGDRSSSDKRGPLNPRLVVAAAVVLLVIVIIVVVALVKRKNGGHQQFSSQPAQGLWGYNWSASGCPR